MKKSKYIILLLIVVIILVTIICILKFNNKITLLKDNSYYSDIEVNNINNIEIIKYTEGGMSSDIIDNKNEIISLYNNLSNIKIGKETNMACEDNTTIYKIIFNNGDSKSIEIECDWIIIDNKRYIIEK